MTKASPSAAGSSASPSDVGDTVSAADSSVKSEKKKKSLLPKIFSSKRGARASDDESSESEFDKNVTARRKAFFEASPVIRKSFSERQTNSRIEGLDLSNYTPFMAQSIEYQDYRMFVGTWNVGGRAPNSDINLDDFLHVEGDSDIYVLGFQEIVPLNAGNVLVIEDNEPAAKWLALINLALNRPQHDSAYLFSDSSPSVKLSKDSKSNFFHKPNLKLLSKNLRVDSSLVKICNCSLESPILGGRRPRRFHDSPLEIHYGSSVKEFISLALDTNSQPNYCLISSKQMVGIFLTVWARKELVPHIGHLGASSIGRGIMGRLGNKGCISISMTLHKTSFCFVCSHLASGEKEGDELKRNADVAEILKSTQFPKICKNPHRLTPTKIIDHDRVIWLGDLNYRMSLSYEETKALMEYSDWGSLLKKDQLNIEREAGRVFTGWKEGQIIFAPTYKYTQNSDLYAGETVKSKKKRRTPAWCDRILWHGNGIDQVSYIRGESRFSDHRPVCAVFSVEVEVRTKNTKFRKGYSCAGTRISAYDNYIPQRHSFYEF